jgi:hypothetical protein
VAPPTVDFDLSPRGEAGSYTMHIQISSDEDLKVLRVFVDGAPIDESALVGRDCELDRVVHLQQGIHWVTAVAYNSSGFSSIPKSAMAQVVDASLPKPKLFYVGVAIDSYVNFPAEKQLRFAKRDMRLLADTLGDEFKREYGALDVKELADSDATPGAILKSLATDVSIAAPGDALIVSFAGHGVKDALDEFYMLTSSASPQDIAGTALPWKKVSEVLSQSKARVIVLLDACHSGVASQDAIVPNDDYASVLMRGSKAGMTVLAASKGRQFSQERDDLMGGHGLFSYAVAQALSRRRDVADTNGDGAIELSELYRYVKTTVAKLSEGAQTPWLSRDEIIGEAPVL